MAEKIVKDSQGLAKDLVNDCISRYGVSAWLANRGYRGLANKVMDEDRFPPVQPECSKEFVMLKVRDLNGRPYYSIIYLEEGCEHEGYASYDLMVISEYLKRYFGFAQLKSYREGYQTGFNEGYHAGFKDAQSERKRGKWIDYANSHCECSVCHTEWSYFQNEVECFEFCPNCGADMREVDE